MLLNHFVIISFTVHNDMLETERNLSVLFCWSLDAAQPRCSVLGWFELISCGNFTFLIFFPTIHQCSNIVCIQKFSKMGSFKPRLLLSVVYTLVVSKHFGLGAFNHFVLNNLHVSCNIQTKHLNYKIYKFHQFLKIVFKDKIFQYPRPKYSIPHEFILPTRTKSILSTL